MRPLLVPELLGFLLGTLLYGHLSRELWWRRSRGGSGRSLLRALMLALLVWYGGCLADELLGLLAPAGRLAGLVGTPLDLLRGSAYLLAYPLLAHAIWRLLVSGRITPPDHPPPSPSGRWLLAGYLTLLGFLPALVAAWQRGEQLLANTSRGVYPWFLLHTGVNTALVVWLLGLALSSAPTARVARALRWLLGSIALVMLLNLLGLPLARYSPSHGWALEIWVLSAIAAGLLPGLVFLYFVRRDNLLRLSLRPASLRHAVLLIGLPAALMLVGLTLGPADAASHARLVAWALLLTLAGAALAGPLARLARRRSRRLRRLLGPVLPAGALERLARELRDTRLDEAAAAALVERSVGEWLDAPARLVPETRREPAHEPLWRHFERHPGAEGFGRRLAPDRELIAALDRAELAAALPLRVRGRTEALLVVGAEGVGAAVDDLLEPLGLALALLASELEGRRALAARLELERRLAEHERLGLLGMVSASLAHELKNPLGAIKALSQNLREELAEAGADPEQVADLDLVLEQIERLHSVARETLELARPAAEQALDLGALVRSSVSVLQHEAARRGVSIALEPLPPRAEVPGGRGQWQTLVFNLLLNAVQHTPAGSVVEVALRRSQDETVFETRNPGEPIPQAIVERLFDPFVSSGGSGLGLALVASRAAELGARVELDNTPGRIMFRLRLPLGAD